MKISEKQIMALIQIANNFLNAPLPDSFDDCKRQVAILLDQINSQQSTELKEVE